MQARSATLTPAVVSLPLWIGGCSNNTQKRPANVPFAAIFASGGKVGWWHYCEFDRNDNQAHCTIWNQGGLVLQEGIFLPSDQKPLKADELKIVYNEHWGDNAQFICLENRRVLVPASDFDRLSRFAEWLEGKRSAP
jgi:hypothetical protein